MKQVSEDSGSNLLQMCGNKAAAEKSVGPQGALFDLKRKTPYYLENLFLLNKIKKLMRNSG